MSKIWIDGKFVESSKAHVSVFDHGLLYGDGCFEGIRVYNGRILKLRSHIVRMFESAAAIRLQPGHSIDEMEEIVRETVAINDQKDGYIRLVFTRGKGTLAGALSGENGRDSLPRTSLARLAKRGCCFTKAKSGGYAASAP